MHETHIRKKKRKNKNVKKYHMIYTAFSTVFRRIKFPQRFSTHGVRFVTRRGLSKTI